MIYGVGMDQSVSVVLGFPFTFPVAGPVIGGLAVDYAISLIWDDCGSYAFILSLGAGVVGAGGTKTFISGDAHLHALRVLKEFGGDACIQDLKSGWGGSFSGAAEAVASVSGDVDVSPDGKKLIFRLGAGAGIGTLAAQLKAGGVYHIVMPFRIRPCPCDLAWWERWLRWVPVGGDLWAFVRGLLK